MTYERREEIFSKDVITLDEMAELLAVSKSAACVKIKEMKFKVGDRLGLSGRIHVQDYLDFCKITSVERYNTESEQKIEKRKEFLKTGLISNIRI